MDYRFHIQGEVKMDDPKCVLAACKVAKMLQPGDTCIVAAESEEYADVFYGLIKSALKEMYPDHQVEPVARGAGTYNDIISKPLDVLRAMPN
jgi:hypothetical protein